MLPSTVVGVLLAAGAGRWYGKPKVLVDGWLDTAVGALRDGGCNDVILVLGAVEVSAPAGVTAITAPDWQQGLSASVRAGLAQADREHADYAVLHVIDTPDVNAKVVARVLGRAWYPAAVWQGAAAYLRTVPDVEAVECGDLASGRDVDVDLRLDPPNGRPRHSWCGRWRGARRPSHDCGPNTSHR